MRNANRLLFAITALATCPGLTSGQRVVPVHDEPRHRVVHQTEDLFVLDVQIQPGDTTLFHTHATPITYVTIGTSSTDSRALGGSWSGTQPRTPPPGQIGAVRGVLRYAERPLTHQVTNVGSTLFRLIAVPSLREGSERPSTRPLSGEAAGDSQWFRYARVELEPGAPNESFTTEAPTVAVLVRAGRVALERGDGWVTSLEAAGSSAVLEEGETVQLINRGERSSTIVLVEVR